MTQPRDLEESGFVKFRRKVRAAEVLSAAVERLLAQLHFTGKVSVVVQKRTSAEIGIRRRVFPKPERPLIHTLWRLN